MLTYLSLKNLKKIPPESPYLPPPSNFNLDISEFTKFKKGMDQMIESSEEEGKAVFSEDSRSSSKRKLQFKEDIEDKESIHEKEKAKKVEVQKEEESSDGLLGLGLDSSEEGEVKGEIEAGEVESNRRPSIPDLAYFEGNRNGQSLVKNTKTDLSKDEKLKSSDVQGKEKLMEGPSLEKKKEIKTKQNDIQKTLIKNTKKSESIFSEDSIFSGDKKETKKIKTFEVKKSAEKKKEIIENEDDSLFDDSDQESKKKETPPAKIQQKSPLKEDIKKPSTKETPIEDKNETISQKLFESSLTPPLENPKIKKRNQKESRSKTPAKQSKEMSQDSKNDRIRRKKRRKERMEKRRERMRLDEDDETDEFMKAFMSQNNNDNFTGMLYSVSGSRTPPALMKRPDSEFRKQANEESKKTRKNETEFHEGSHDKRNTLNYPNIEDYKQRKEKKGLSGQTKKEYKTVKMPTEINPEDFISFKKRSLSKKNKKKSKKKRIKKKTEKVKLNSIIEKLESKKKQKKKKKKKSLEK